MLMRSNWNLIKVRQKEDRRDMERHSKNTIRWKVLLAVFLKLSAIKMRLVFMEFATRI
jgi:hypothetical protein